MRRSKNNQDEEKLMEINAEMQGKLSFKDPVRLRINGNFDGSLDTKGSLEVGEKASVKADIVGDDIVIAGQITGNIIARKSLKLTSTCILKGNVRTSSFCVEHGALFDGQSTMSGNIEAQETMNKTELASYLNVDVEKINDWIKTADMPIDDLKGKKVFKKSKVDQWVLDNKLVSQ